MNSNDNRSKGMVGLAGSLLDKERGVGIYAGLSLKPVNPFAVVREEVPTYLPYVKRSTTGVGTRYGDPTTMKHLITDEEMRGVRKGVQVASKPPSAGPQSDPAGGELILPPVQFDRPGRGLRPVDRDDQETKKGFVDPPPVTGKPPGSPPTTPDPASTITDPASTIPDPGDLSGETKHSNTPSSISTPGGTPGVATSPAGTPGAAGGTGGIGGTAGAPGGAMKPPEKPKLSSDPSVKTTAKTAGKMLELGKQFGSAAAEKTGAGAVGLMTGLAERAIRSPIEKQRHAEAKQDREAIRQYQQQMSEFKGHQATQAKQAQADAAAKVKQGQADAVAKVQQGQAIKQAGSQLMSSSPVPFHQPQSPAQLIAPPKPIVAAPKPMGPVSAATPKVTGGMRLASQGMKMTPSPLAPIIPQKAPPVTPTVPASPNPALKQMLGELPKSKYTPPPQAPQTGGPRLSPEQLATLRRGFIEVGRGEDVDEMSKGIAMRYGGPMFVSGIGGHGDGFCGSDRSHSALAFMGTPFHARALEIQAEGHENRAKDREVSFDGVKDGDKEKYFKKLKEMQQRDNETEAKWHRLEAERDKWRASEVRKDDKTQKSLSDASILHYDDIQSLYKEKIPKSRHSGRGEAHLPKGYVKKSMNFWSRINKVS